jgi:hypothetical protein
MQIIVGGREPKLPAWRGCGRVPPGRLGGRGGTGPGIHPPGRMREGRVASGAMGGKINSEDRQLSGKVGAKSWLLAPYADVTLRVWNHGCTEELVPVLGGDSEGGDNDGSSSVRARLGDKEVDDWWWGGEAKSVWLWQRPQARQVEWAQSGTVNASSASVRGSEYRAKKLGRARFDSDAKTSTVRVQPQTEASWWARARTRSLLTGPATRPSRGSGRRHIPPPGHGRERGGGEWCTVPHVPGSRTEGHTAAGRWR